MPAQGTSEGEQNTSSNSNPFRYQPDMYLQQQQQQQQQQQHQQQNILPKVRNLNNPTATSSNSRNVPAQYAAPATPRMLRNASNNVLNPTNNNLNDYHINPNFQFQLLQPTDELQRSNLPSGSRNVSRNQPPSLLQAGTPIVPQLQQQQGYETPPPKSSLNPPAIVHNEKAPPQRTPSTSTHSRTSSSTQKPQPQQIVTDQKTNGQFHRKSIGEWEFYKTIGAGSMGKVKLAKHRRTNEVCAVKVVPRTAKIWLRQHSTDPPTTDPDEVQKNMKEYAKEVERDKRTIREAALDKIMYHPYICRLYELIPMTNHYYMLFEYVSGGQMLDYIVSHGSLKDRHARKFARGILSALDYCHSNNIVHRDLKIENIMISKTGEIKIIDFGLSNMFDKRKLLKTFCGSLYFAAPELLSSKPYTGPEVDIWSFGVVLYVLLCGKVPFDDASVSVLHSKIKEGHVVYPDHLSWSSVSLLQRMLVVNPAKRATLKEIINHPWMIDESEKPVYNYLPHREPLTFPLNLEVVDEIVNLQLGAKNQVLNDLAEIISSHEYRVAVEHWHNQRNGGFTISSDPQSIPQDPTVGYHPLISIYYLVDEMQKRKKLKMMANKSSLEQAEEQERLQKQAISAPVSAPVAPYTMNTAAPHTPEPPTPVLSFPEAAYTASHGGTNAGNYNNKDALGIAQGVDIPNQQDSRSQSPRMRKSSNIDDKLSSPGRQDDEDQGKTNFNSLLRKLSGKRTSREGSSNTNNNFENLPPVPTLRSPSPLESSQLQSYQPQPFQPPQVDPIVRRVGSMKITSKEKQLVRDQKGFPPLPLKSEQQMQQHQRAVSTSASTYAKRNPPAIVVEETARTPTPATRKMHPSARAKSVGHVRKSSLLHSKNDPNAPPVPEMPHGYHDDGFFDDVSLTEDDYAKRQENLANVASADLTENQLVEAFHSAPTGTMPSIEYPRTLFLKGFFSVQTTSTKPLPVIRNNIIVVLSKLGVQFREVKGGFICAHTPSIASTINSAPPNPEVEIETGDNLENLEDPAGPTELQMKHSSSNSSDPRDDLSMNSSLTSSPSNALSKSHRRKFSLGSGLLRKKPEQPGRLNTNFSTTPTVYDTSNMPLTPAPANVHRHRHSHSITSTDSQESLDSLHDIRGGSDTLISSRIDQVRSPKATHRSSFTNEKGTKSRSVLKFEIHIVKVPLVGLYGVQFKKLTGNTWMYKTLAGEILSELNL